MRLLKKNEGYLYKLYFEGVLQYIGKTTQLQTRLHTHTKTKVFDKVEVAVVGLDVLEKLEMSLIMEFNPPLNKTKITSLAAYGDEARKQCGQIVFEDAGWDSSYAEESKKSLRAAALKIEVEEYVKTMLLETEPMIAKLCVENMLPKKDWIKRETLEDIIRSNNLSEFLCLAETNKKTLLECNAGRYVSYMKSERLLSKYADDEAIL